MSTRYLKNLPSLVEACRPRQWTKNLLVFLAPLFTFRIDVNIWLSACVALVSFCLVSSSIYLLNDVLDLEADREHPLKSSRPIAAGLVTKNRALYTSLLLTIVGISLASLVSPSLVVVFIAYIFIHVFYCVRLKHEPLLDLFCIASGFLLRAIAGGIAASLPLSPWFLLTIALLALFVAVEKRKAELHLTKERGVVTRQVLNLYSSAKISRCGLGATPGHVPA